VLVKLVNNLGGSSIVQKTKIREQSDNFEKNFLNFRTGRTLKNLKRRRKGKGERDKRTKKKKRIRNSMCHPS